MVRSVDPRVIRTRRLLIDALTKLIITNGEEAISIRDIVREAEVNRSTFYLHFQDKQDILMHLYDDLLSKFISSLKYPQYVYEVAVQEYKSQEKPIPAHTAMFDHIERYAELYQKVLKENEFRERVNEVIKREVLLFTDNVMEATFMANGSVGLILYWLENGRKESVLEMSRWLTHITLFPLGKFNKSM
ncbi:TetR/AcrR family transcriptional regulator [Paenibacillus yanchengensis]|uniref:TetR/AcrR family transcriptional regulator n=1 Tax=Paenibacillus yanchengensis TaxID=2035833 RepID=A0ABW4YJB5_9BACL